MGLDELIEQVGIAVDNEIRFFKDNLKNKFKEILTNYFSLDERIGKHICRKIITDIELSDDLTPSLKSGDLLNVSWYFQTDCALTEDDKNSLSEFIKGCGEDIITTTKKNSYFNLLFQADITLKGIEYLQSFENLAKNILLDTLSLKEGIISLKGWMEEEIKKSSLLEEELGWKYAVIPSETSNRFNNEIKNRVKERVFLLMENVNPSIFMDLFLHSEWIANSPLFENLFDDIVTSDYKSKNKFYHLTKISDLFVTCKNYDMIYRILKPYFKVSPDFSYLLYIYLERKHHFNQNNLDSETLISYESLFAELVPFTDFTKAVEMLWDHPSSISSIFFNIENAGKETRNHLIRVYSNLEFVTTLLNHLNDDDIYKIIESINKGSFKEGKMYDKPTGEKLFDRIKIEASFSRPGNLFETELNYFFSNLKDDYEYLVLIDYILEKSEFRDLYEVIECAGMDLRHRGLTITSRLGMGGSGRVYKAECTGFEKTIKHENNKEHERLVVKVKFYDPKGMSPEMKRKHKREGISGIISEFNKFARPEYRHPNLVAYHAPAFFEGGEIVIVKDYVDGGSIQDFIDGKVPSGIRRIGKATEVFSIDEIFSGMLDGVGFLHGKELILRDIKLENTLISPQNKIVKIDDFETAIHEKDLQTKIKEQGGMLKRENITLSSDRYHAPEIMRTNIPSKQTDIYALGACLLYMLRKEKKKPDDESNKDKWPIRHLNILGEDEYNQGLEKVLQQLPFRYSIALRKALAYRPEDRFKDTNEFKTALIPKKPEEFGFALNQLNKRKQRKWAVEISLGNFFEHAHLNNAIIFLDEILGYEDQNKSYPLFFIGTKDKSNTRRIFILANGLHNMDGIYDITDDYSGVIIWHSGKINSYHIADAIVNYIKSKSPDVDEKTLSVFKDMLTKPFDFKDHEDMTNKYMPNLKLMRKYLAKLL